MSFVVARPLLERTEAAAFVVDGGVLVWSLILVIRNGLVDGLAPPGGRNVVAMRCASIDMRRTFIHSAGVDGATIGVVGPGSICVEDRCMNAVGSLDLDIVRQRVVIVTGKLGSIAFESLGVIRVVCAVGNLDLDILRQRVVIVTGTLGSIAFESLGVNQVVSAVVSNTALRNGIKSASKLSYLNCSDAVLP